MSLREIDVALRQIAKRRNEEYRMQAALHGVRLEGSATEAPRVELSEDQEKLAMKHIEETLARKRREYADREQR
jgi:hypothetical protein